MTFKFSSTSLNRSASNSANEDDEDNSTYTLTFTIEFEHDDDTVFFAHSYPYTYSDLQDYLMEIQRHPVKSKFCKLRLLCRTLAGNNVYYLTVTAPSTNEENMRVRELIYFPLERYYISLQICSERNQLWSRRVCIPVRRRHRG